MRSTKNGEPRFAFYLEWIPLNALTVIVGWFVTLALISRIASLIGGTIQVGGQTRITEDFLFLYVFFPTVGLLIGLIQFMLLRRYLAHMEAWIPMTFLGWLLPFLLGYVITRFLTPDNSTPWLVIGLGLIGTAIATPQWWILRRRVQHASWWILFNGLGWGMVGLMNLVTKEPMPILYTLALSTSIVTGLACWLLLDWLPRQNLSSSSSH